MGQFTGTPSKGAAAEKGEPKMFRAARCFFSDLQVLDQLRRDNDTPLQSVHPTQISLARYGLGDASKVGFQVYYPCPMREVMAWKMDLEGCTLDMEFRVINTRVNPVTTGN